MKYTKVFAAKDDSGHWYVVPSELESKWKKLLTNLEELEGDDDSDVKFEEAFGQYRTGGDLNLIQLYIESK